MSRNGRTAMDLSACGTLTPAAMTGGGERELNHPLSTTTYDPAAAKTTGMAMSHQRARVDRAATAPDADAVGNVCAGELSWVAGAGSFIGVTVATSRYPRRG